MIQNSAELTERERETMAHDKLMLDTQCEHVQRVKEIERDAKKLELEMRAKQADASRWSQERAKQAELELAELEAKWLSWLKVPLTLVRLPLYIVLGIAVCIGMARKSDVPDKLYALLK